MIAVIILASAWLLRRWPAWHGNEEGERGDGGRSVKEAYAGGAGAATAAGRAQPTARSWLPKWDPQLLVARRTATAMGAERTFLSWVGSSPVGAMCNEDGTLSTTSHEGRPACICAPGWVGIECGTPQTSAEPRATESKRDQV